MFIRGEEYGGKEDARASREVPRMQVLAQPRPAADVRGAVGCLMNTCREEVLSHGFAVPSLGASCHRSCLNPHATALSIYSRVGQLRRYPLMHSEQYFRLTGQKPQLPKKRWADGRTHV